MDSALPGSGPDASSALALVWPALQHLPSYVAALERGWSWDNHRPEAAQEELALIAEDSALFVARQVDRKAEGRPILLSDGTTTPRLPGYRRWMWGYATRALGLFLRDVEEEGLPFVELITNTTNESSRRVIEKNGGVFVERFRGPDQQGAHEELRFRIPLPRPLNDTPSHSSTARSGPP